MNAKTYLEHHLGRCPECKAKIDRSLGEVQILDGSVVVTQYCEECDHTYAEIHELVQIATVEPQHGVPTMLTTEGWL